ncbi:MAG: aminoacyltransferase, partial [Thermanaerothrix sp.]|nr:aminoacyltransferase [Thermanaerothrix sp.]
MIVERFHHREDWDRALIHLPKANILQTWEWAQIKSSYGWQPYPLVWRGDNGQVQAMALVLRRALSIGGIPTPLSVMYVPRGPVMDWGDSDLRGRVLDDLKRLAQAERAIFIKIDPDVELGWGLPDDPEKRENPIAGDVMRDLQTRGWFVSPEQVQFRNTFILSLEGDEEVWLGRMKQKTRYNIRLAQRKGVTVRRATPEDFPLLYRMYAETSVRDGFVIRPEPYYHQVWGTFLRAGMAEPLIAEVEGTPVAGLV